MGSKYKPEKNLNPGPGHYNNADQQLLTKSASVRIGSSTRPDIWEDKSKKD